ncbi:carbohydrate ABC transporter permease [Candidatus Sumerlaeota bacterium]|nr:carbohydrate ABC transporter permease [Candidatus Sumerlaeota bacterium]
MKRKRQDFWLHFILMIIVFLTMVPFLFVLNNSFRSNTEMYHAFFGFPRNMKDMIRFSSYKLTGKEEQIELKVLDENAPQDIRASELAPTKMTYPEAMSHLFREMTKGYRYCWDYLKPYMLNTFLVCIATALGVILIGSISAYVFSRYRFPGNRFLFLIVLSIMMIPHILTLVPSFLLVKKLGLLNSYWVLILPYTAGGQIFSIFVFKSFFDGLPEDLFESARIDGAGHFSLYWNIVLPLSKPVIAVVAVVNILGTWNNFLWPFICNNDPKYHVVASGLFLMNATQVAANMSTMYAAYTLSSLPLLVLFIYATKPFIKGVTTGAFKA